MKVLSALVVCVAVLLRINKVIAAGPAATRYDDFKVYRVFVENDQQLSEFKKISNNLPVHYLNEIGGPGRSYDLVIDPANQQRLEQHMQLTDLSFKLVINDLQKILEEGGYQRSSASEPMEWTQYHSLFDIYNWLDNIASKNNRIVTSYTIGYSYEGRPIKAVKISTRPFNKAIFVESNIHAVEKISSATSTCFFDSLLKANNTDMKNLLNNYDWFFVPVLNPDGFEYTRRQTLWRKNRKPTGFSNSSGICYGTDLNRNFNFKWGGAGWNIDVPCDHWYGGAQPNSEPEVIALQNFVNDILKQNKDDYIRMYLAIHSYGNFILLPYGHTSTEFPPNYDQMMRIANSFAEAAKVRYGTVFQPGASGVVNYPVSGSAKDWAYGEKNIPFTATIELRDKGEYGFFLPESQILEVCAEVTDGLIAMVKQATAEGLLTPEPDVGGGAQGVFGGSQKLSKTLVYLMTVILISYVV